MNPSPNSTSVEIVISPKSLERQIKLLDDRLLELQIEVASLEKTREACYVLLGGSPAVCASTDNSSVNAKKAPPKRKRSSDVLDAAEEENTSSVDFSALQAMPEHAPV
jgi:hypothetical protein